ncbi:EamA family transporter [Microbacterium oleivorans]|uniref:EamA family transporter n=1 Tax=Microbacterium oleivorans TaxID=273677 RepID=A0A7D5IXR6_9MICO|nr:EamA family transporter [Microbacterium oleivorans]QLD10635.1 EamA family transporter [Microbacterium oleivorans]
MLSYRSAVVTTALAPAIWGTTYVTATTFVAGGHPLLTGTVRALPAGLILLAIARRLPVGAWWWRAWVLGALNITTFFACLFIAAERLPGGVAAVVGGIQPLLVAVLGWVVLSERMNAVILGAGLAGVVGVGLIVLQSSAGLDGVGIAAAIGGASAMAVGTVLAKRWSPGLPPLATTAWQLIAGGILLAVLTAVIEPLPSTAPTAPTLAGYAYLSIVGTAFAYVVWFRGLAALPARVPAFLGLLSPVVAVLIGILAVGESLTPPQTAGIVLVIGSVLAVAAGSTRRRRRCPRWDSNPD